MEAGAGIEPANRGFADLGLTTWLPRRRKDGKLTPRERLSIGDVRGKNGFRDEQVQRIQRIERIQRPERIHRAQCLEAPYGLSGLSGLWGPIQLPEPAEPAHP
jgi:hypothetical protein